MGLTQLPIEKNGDGVVGAYPMFGVTPTGPGAPARENVLFSRPFTQNGPSVGPKV